MTDELIMLVQSPQTICDDCIEIVRHRYETAGIVRCKHTHFVGTGVTKGTVSTKAPRGDQTRDICL